MKRLIIVVTLAIGMILHSSNLWAKYYKIFICYPGEVGSPVEAKPVLDAFFEYLEKNSKGNNFSGQYSNSPTGCLKYVGNKKPQFGIFSWIALQENEGSLPPYKMIASTIPYPHGTTSDVFTLVGYSEKGMEGDWNPAENLVVHSSIPMSIAFLKSRLMPDISGNISIQTTKTPLGTLKKISSGYNPNHVALLTPMEMHTLKNLKSEWAKHLVTLQESKPIPTPPFIYFGEKPKITDELVTVLTNMSNDPEGEEILETLRLKGFMPVN